MALPAALVWEVRTTGSDSLNSGGFVAGASGTDYSQQNAAQYSATDLVVDATTNTKVTSVSHSFVSTDVGNILRVTAGASWTQGFYQIVSVAAGAATLDRSPAATSTSGGSYCVGGALATPGQALAAHVAGNQVYLKASGTYSNTSTSNNVAGGILTLTAGTAAAKTRLIGYTSSRGDGGSATIQASGIASTTMLTLNAPTAAENLIFDGASLTGMKGCTSTGGECRNVSFKNCKNFSYVGTQASTALFCEFTGCSGGAESAVGGTFRFCSSHDNSVSGFANGVYLFCISDSNTGASSSGWLTSTYTECMNCVAYNNGKDGWNVSGTAAIGLVNCVATANAGYGCNSASSYDVARLTNFATYNNTSGATNNITAASIVTAITLGADPFTNAAGNDFSLTNSNPGGAQLRAAGFSATYPGLSTNSYLDVGAAQHQDAGGGTTNVFWIGDG